MSVRNRRLATTTAGGATAAPRHFGRSASLVDENQFFRFKIQLGLEPGPPTPQHVRALLLAGVSGFF